MLIVGVVFFGIFTLVSGPLAERFGRRALLIVRDERDPRLRLPVRAVLRRRRGRGPGLLIVGFTLMGLTFGPMGAVLPELFPTNVRYTGSAISYNVASILGAAVAPFIAVALWQAAGGSTWLVGLYLSSMAVLTLVALCSAARRSTWSTTPRAERPAAVPAHAAGGRAAPSQRRRRSASGRDEVPWSTAISPRPSAERHHELRHEPLRPEHSILVVPRTCPRTARSSGRAGRTGPPRGGRAPRDVPPAAALPVRAQEGDGRHHRAQRAGRRRLARPAPPRQQVITLVQQGETLGRLVWALVALVVVAGLLSGFQHYLLQRTGEGVVLSSRRRARGEPAAPAGQRVRPSPHGRPRVARRQPTRPCCGPC